MDKYIVFINNEQRFALDIYYVDKIIEFEEPKNIPDSSTYLLGVIQYNGNILPVIDLTNRLYNIFTDDSKDDKIIIVRYKGKELGFVVGKMEGIKAFHKEDFEASKIDSEISAEYIQGFIKANEDITIVLNIDKLFNFQQEEELALLAND